MAANLLDPVTLEIFNHLFASVAEEMGAALGRTGYSPNIKERRDYSCAVFLSDGRLLAQAAHIPVHLGAMPASVLTAIEHGSPFTPGDVMVLNDPYLGGTHLPDITLVSPVFVAEASAPGFFLASRAHHADVGGMSPGSMPLSTELYQEGIIIPPILLVNAGQPNQAVFDLIARNSRTPDERRGDLQAQLGAHHTGAVRIREIAARYGLPEISRQAEALIHYAELLTRDLIESLPDGRYYYEDALDDDGISDAAVPIRVTVTIDRRELTVDFTGSSPPVAGSINAVPAIALSAVGYVIRCLVRDSVPSNQGVLLPVKVIIPADSVLDPGSPHAVAGGNVETSMRIVDVVYGALAQAAPNLIPADSQGTMNNLTFGGIHPTHNRPFAYYETMGGGSGAGPQSVGAHGVHCHMSNTLNTPVEALELALPVRVRRYSVRRSSGGDGLFRGGDGLERELEFLSSAQVTLLSDRRRMPPRGLAGGEAGACGDNTLYNRDNPHGVRLPGKATFPVLPGDILSVKTPGGGGWGGRAKPMKRL